MSADFWAGYISGAIGIIVGNPLDLIKVRLQANTHNSPSPTATITNTFPPVTNSFSSQFSSAGSLIRGATAPILGYGALNALLFVTYNRTSQFLTHYQYQPQYQHQTYSQPPAANLTTTFIAGVVGGLATWVVSTPTELIKCRAQLSSSSSWSITRSILRTEGIRGLYFGGVVTALRDSVGYGFYFWSYELSTRFLASRLRADVKNGDAAVGVAGKSGMEDAARVLLCGGLAGVVTWLSIFPLDVVKTRVQMQVLESSHSLEPFNPRLSHATPLLPSASALDQPRRLGAMAIARHAYATEGTGVFFRGLAVCSVRAFVVNAVQWAVYEWIMRELDTSSGTEAGRGVKVAVKGNSAEGMLLD